MNSSKSLFVDRYRFRKRMGRVFLWEAWLTDNEMAGYERRWLDFFAPVDEPGRGHSAASFARAYLMHPRLLQSTYFDISGRPVAHIW